MINVKLMHELLNEIKNKLVYDDNSLAHALTQVRIGINDVEKINFSHDHSDTELQKNVNKLDEVVSNLNQFKQGYNALYEQLDSLLKPVFLSSRNTQLFASGTNLAEPINTDLLAAKKKAEEYAKQVADEAAAGLQNKIEQAKNDLVTKAVEVEHE